MEQVGGFLRVREPGAGVVFLDVVWRRVGGAAGLAPAALVSGGLGLSLLLDYK